MSKMKEKKQIICKNIGFRLVFNWPIQLARRAKKCTKPASETKKKRYILKDGIYVCCICNKSCAHQSYIIRHTKAYNGSTRKGKAVFSCDTCSKCFDLKCCLRAHLKSHLHKCKNCNQRFRRTDYLNNINWVVLIPTMYNSYLHLLPLFYQLNHQWTHQNFLSKLSKLS